MSILAIDTSTALLGIGLKSDNAYFEINQDIGLHHTENLLVEVDHLFRKAEISSSDLELIVVSKGPGSFTGLRIGMAAAKGISFGTGAPIVSVSHLDTFAYSRKYYHGTICPVIDARKQRVYTAFYNQGKRISEYLDITPQELQEACSRHSRLLLTGPYAKDLAEMWSETGVDFELDPAYGRPLTWELLHHGIDLHATQGPDSPAEGPLYIRPSEAELSLKQKAEEKKD